MAEAEAIHKAKKLSRIVGHCTNLHVEHPTLKGISQSGVKSCLKRKNSSDKETCSLISRCTCERRSFIGDSGASFHFIGTEYLTSEGKKSIRPREAQVMTTANGKYAVIKRRIFILTSSVKEYGSGCWTKHHLYYR